MRLDLHSLQITAMVIVFVLIFAGRLVRGSARLTSRGLTFPLKPLVLFSRAVALPLYFILFAYPLWISRQSIPPWLLILLLCAVLVGAYQFPGTIVLTEKGVLQRFWFRADIFMPYGQIATIQAARTGGVTRVLNAKRLLITHTFNHCASDRFRSELEQRSGKRVEG